MRRLAPAALSLLTACSLLTDFDQFSRPVADASAPSVDAGAVDATIDADAAPLCAEHTDFSGDPKNCGTCRHDCLGGGCLAGQCQKILLARGLKSYHVRVDATHAYLADAEARQIVRVPKRGGSVEVLVAGQDGLYELAVNDQYAFYHTGVALDRVPKAGGNPSHVAMGGNVLFVAVDPQAVYWTENQDPANARLHRADFDGENAGVLADRMAVAETIAIDGDDVYFGDSGNDAHSGNLWHLDKKTGQKSVLANAGCRRLAIDATTVYWLDYVSPNVYAIPRAGGPKTTLATAAAETVGADIAVDDAFVYWAVENTPGGVFRVSKRGGAVETIDTAPSTTGVAVDDAAVYWTVAPAGEVYFRAR